MASIISLISRLYKIVNPPSVPKKAFAVGTSGPPEINGRPLRFGILGAANIAPIALVLPARSHPDVVVYAVAARNLAKAEAFATKYGVEKAYEGYQALLDDPAVDVVYNPLPNGLHYEWTMKALAAGKHVLNEKPSANTAEETKEMFDLAARKGVVLLDAYHYRFHPALKRAKAIVDSRELGTVKHVHVDMVLSPGIIREGDIRYDFSLGGGAMMDLGCYAMSCARYMSSADPISVIGTSHVPYVPRPEPPGYIKNIDKRMEATLAMPNDATISMTCDLSAPLTLGFIPKFPQIRTRVECTLGTLEMFNHVMPTIYHSITVRNRGGATRVEKVYKAQQLEGAKPVVGEEWWTTYRFQLEALVDKIRGREPETWLTAEDSIATMEWIEKVYQKAGLGSRPRSGYVPSA